MRWLTFALFAALIAACDPEPEFLPADAGRVDLGPAADAGTPDAATPDAAPPPPDAGPSGLKATRPVTAAEPYVHDGPWFITALVAGGDVLGQSYFERRFVVPTSTGTVDGVRWTAATPDENGGFFVFGTNRTVYITTVLETQESLRLLVRLDQVEIMVDNQTVHSPDPYRTGRVVHPIALAPGRHELVFRGRNDRAAPAVRFERVTSPLQPNLQDTTFPDLQPGEARAQPLGIHAVNLAGQALTDVRAVVLDHPLFEATARSQGPMARDTLTAVAFDLVPRGPLPADVETATLTLGLQAAEIDGLHTFEYALPIAPVDRGVRRTFISSMDASAQYYAVTGPSTPPDSAALLLSLHGAAVQARGQARAYGVKDWIYVVAPTNRRPFGFDWQDWGRLDAMEVLADAQRELPIDPEQIHLSGHSMGGHGSWHLGALYPDRFAGVGPSAGWRDFASYGGSPNLPPAWNAGRLHDTTLDFKSNFANRSVYIIHGTADNNVPIAQARTMYQELQGIPQDLLLHEEPGAGHWWDRDPEPGARCVDFREMFELFRPRRNTLTELDFRFVSPAPWVSPSRSFATVEAVEDPYRVFELRAATAGSVTTVDTDNVAALVLDGARLEAAGITEVIVDGVQQRVSAESLRFGEALKRPGRHGPFKEVFFKPFCFIHADGDESWRSVATELTGIWAVIGNGAGCTLPFSRRDEAGARNRIYLGVRSADIGVPAELGMTWSADAVTIDGVANTRPTFLGVTFPEGDHLSGSLFGTTGAEWLATFVQPFSSRSAFPDWFTFVVGDQGPAYGPAGWFDANWRYDANLRR